MPERLELPTGELMQRPPAYSAVKVGGERAYEKARRGETPEVQPRPVTVHRAELLWHEGDRAAFEIECSSGTYVRSSVADLGDAYCEELERTAIGPFRLEDADPERDRAARRGARVPARSARSTRRRRDARPARAPGRRRRQRRTGTPCASPTTASCSRSPSRARHELQPVVVFAPA